MEFTSDEYRLAEAHIYLVTVPTPIQSGKIPDLQYIRQASQIVGDKLSKDNVVVYESTVYPGVTEEICIPILEQASGLRCGIDFKVGYSPERINPGDKENRLENIIKIVSGNDEQALHLIARIYELIIEAGVHRAESIKVAEAAKVIENAQRDVNIAFMNELAMIFHRLGIDTKSVIEAAKTKWNFIPFSPGLVGGHCIGIDPYYLTHKAEDSGIHSKIIVAGRQINEGMGSFIARQFLKMLVRSKLDVQQVRTAIFGFTYKENHSDIRNTKVIDIVNELMEWGLTPYIVDPLADPIEVNEQYGMQLTDLNSLPFLDAIIIAVPHETFRQMNTQDIIALYNFNSPKILVDVKGIFEKNDFEHPQFHYWRL